jgi:hypothetical protein
MTDERIIQEYKQGARVNSIINQYMREINEKIFLENSKIKKGKNKVQKLTLWEARFHVETILVNMIVAENKAYENKKNKEKEHG